MAHYYNLEGRTVVETDVLHMKLDNRRVAVTDFVDHNGNEIKISTVFLGLDHSHNNSRVLFETMIFGGDYNEWCWRYNTFDQAELAHHMIHIYLKHGMNLSSLDLSLLI